MKVGIPPSAVSISTSEFFGIIIYYRTIPASMENVAASLDVAAATMEATAKDEVVGSFAGASYFSGGPGRLT